MITGNLEFIIIGIQFNQNGVGFIYIDTIVVKSHLLRKIITAAIFAIEIQLHRNHVVGSCGLYQPCYLHTNRIGHH